MTEEEKANVDLTKILQKSLQIMERDRRTFIRYAHMDKSKLPASLHPLLSKYHKNNTSHTTTLINTAHAIKLLDPMMSTYTSTRRWLTRPWRPMLSTWSA